MTQPIPYLLSDPNRVVRVPLLRIPMRDDKPRDIDAVTADASVCQCSTSLCCSEQPTDWGD